MFRLSGSKWGSGPPHKLLWRFRFLRAALCISVTVRTVFCCLFAQELQMKRKTNDQSLKACPRMSSRKHLAGSMYVYVVLSGGVMRAFRKLTAYVQFA